MATLLKLSRPQLLRICSDFSAIDAVHDSVMKRANQALIDRVKKLAEKLMPTDPAMGKKIVSLQTAIRYNFRNPVLAQHLLTHATYSVKNKDEIRLFKELEFLGDRMIGIVSRLYLQQEYPLAIEEEKGDQIPFPQSAIGLINSAVVSNDYLGRLAVADRLFDYLRHQASEDVCKNVRKFQLAVHQGRYDVHSPNILADSFEAYAGGLSVDSGSPDAFYELFVSRLRISQNPVFVLFDGCRKDAPSVTFPTFVQLGGKWKVERFGSLIAEGDTILEAADAANKYLAIGGMNKAASTFASVNAIKLDKETNNLSHERVPSELTKSLVQARTEKKWTQMINVKPQVVQEYESAKVVPDLQVISKLEKAPDVKLRDESLPFELKKSLVQARTEKKWTRAQLAHKINVKPQVIEEYESGKAIPNPQVIYKLERALGVELRG